MARFTEYLITTRVKMTATQEIVTTVSPSTGLEKCVVDVSLLAGILAVYLTHFHGHIQHWVNDKVSAKGGRLQSR